MSKSNLIEVLFETNPVEDLTVVVKRKDGVISVLEMMKGKIDCSIVKFYLDNSVNSWSLHGASTKYRMQLAEKHRSLTGGKLIEKPVKASQIIDGYGDVADNQVWVNDLWTSPSQLSIGLLEFSKRVGVNRHIYPTKKLVTPQKFVYLWNELKFNSNSYFSMFVIDVANYLDKFLSTVFIVAGSWVQKLGFKWNCVNLPSLDKQRIICSEKWFLTIPDLRCLSGNWSIWVVKLNCKEMLFGRFDVADERFSTYGELREDEEQVQLMRSDMNYCATGLPPLEINE